MHTDSPDNSEAGLERAIQDAGADVAPRVTPDDVEAVIASEHYFTAAEGHCGAAWMRVMDDHSGVINAFDAEVPPAPLGTLTFCVLVLRNGFTVTGESACASPENFNAEIGRRVALDNAKRKIWPLLGYTLREQMHRDVQLSLAVGEAWPDQ